MAKRLQPSQCVMGKFVVHDNLPLHLAQGMFKKPGTHNVIMRYSSLTPKILPDNIPAPRGIGMKIFGIEGEKLWGEDKKTQDWTYNNYPILELRDPQTTYDIADALERNWNDLPTFAAEQSKRVDADVATLGSQLPRQNKYSQLAYRHGDYVAKYGVFPLSTAKLDLADAEIGESEPIDVISQNLGAFHLAHKVTYSFCVQLLQNLTRQSVDDIGMLGSTNRMRRVVYAGSRKLRLRVNGYRNYVEPGCVEEVPRGKESPQLELKY